MLADGFVIEQVQDARHAVAAANAEYRVHLPVQKQPHEIAGAIAVAPGEEAEAATGARREPGLETQILNRGDGAINGVVLARLKCEHRHQMGMEIGVAGVELADDDRLSRHDVIDCA